MCVVQRKRPCCTCPGVSSSPPPPPQEKPSTTYPKTPPHQDFSSPVHCSRDRSHEQPPGTNPRARVSVIKNTSLQALLPLNGYSVRGVSPNQRNRDVFPHTGPELSAHPPRSGGHPDHLSSLPCPDSKRSTRRQNPQSPFIFFLFPSTTH